MAQQASTLTKRSACRKRTTIERNRLYYEYHEATYSYRKPVAPVAYQVILEPGIGQFREFEPRRLHTRINSLGLFLVDKLTCGKRESVS